MPLRKIIPVALMAPFAALLTLFAWSVTGPVAEADAIQPAPRIAVNDRGPVFSDRCIVLGPKAQSPYRECVYGNPRARNRHVVVFGDSHGLQWTPTLIRLAEENNWRLTVLVRQGCVVAQVRFERWCDAWRANTMRRIVRRERPQLVVVSTATTGRYKVVRGGRTLSRDESQPHLIRGMRRTLERLRDTGARVAVIRDQVRAQQHPPTCVQRNMRTANRACSFRPTGRRDRQGFDYEAARRTPIVRVIDPKPILCPNGNCLVVKSGLLMYRDTYHLTATYARHIAPWLERQLPPVRKWK